MPARVPLEWLSVRSQRSRTRTRPRSPPVSRDACIELAKTAGRDPEDVVEWWTERAAIREHDAGSTRASAEAAALDDIRAALAVSTRIGPKRVDSIAASSDDVVRAKK